MGLRFRRSVRLFPGVRLNFSRSGVSTSIGVRGASVTVGSRGTYANVGIPGSGLSYRTRLDTPVLRAPTDPTPSWQPSQPRRPTTSPIHSPGVASIPGTETQIRSADVELLTSPGLGELKQLINEATAKKAELRDQQTKHTAGLKRAAGKLRLAEFIVIRLFTEKAIPVLVEKANAANDLLEETTVHLEGCFVEVDFAFDDGTRNSYSALTKAFEALRACQKIWDITQTAYVDRVAQRTTAHSALTRVPVIFDFTESDIIRSQYRAMRLGNVGGRDLQIFPGFVMMRDASRDFALIEFADFECRYAPSNFIEEDAVPSDAERIGSTWKRANKDGSRDRRFNDNYQIPILRYGGLAFSSPTGLGEAYQASDWEKAHGFSQAIAAHKRALASMNTPADMSALPPPSDIEEDGGTPADLAPVFVAKTRNNLALDWTVLAVLVAFLGVGSFWTGQHWSAISKALAPPPPVHIAVIAPPPLPTRPAVKHKRRLRHHQPANVAPVNASTPAVDTPATSAAEPTTPNTTD